MADSYTPGENIDLYVPGKGWVACKVYKHSNGELVIVGPGILFPAALLATTIMTRRLTAHSPITAAGRPNVPGYGLVVPGKGKEG